MSVKGNSDRKKNIKVTVVKAVPLHDKAHEVLRKSLRDRIIDI